MRGVIRLRVHRDYFGEFLFRLKEHFDTGFMIDDESALEDLETVNDLKGPWL